ncbi:mechanosensitive ion channel [Alteromonadaceae bacterium BrNp21-10]|nr:mechanosensitive ion channel [Alteromonadaceae bacterium BrNp21-10]
MNETNSNWQSAFTQSYDLLIKNILAYVPQLLGALVLMLIGWIVAWILAKVTLTLMSLLNRIMVKVSQSLHVNKPWNLKPQHVQVASKSVFWITLIFFAAATTSSMGLDFFATWLGAILSYLPNLLAGLVIIIGGYLLGNLASAMARATAQSAGFEQVQTIGNMVKLAVVFTALVIGVEQLGINIQFITNLVIVLTGVLSAGIALAFGLGSKQLIANTVAARQIKHHCQIDDHISIAGVEGTLTEITATMLIIETQQGRTLVPASEFMRQASNINAPQSINDK